MHERLCHPPILRVREQLQIILQTIQKNYTYLTNMQAQAITSTTDERLCPNRSSAFVCGISINVCVTVDGTKKLSQFEKDLLKTFAEITRQDVLLANYVIRARCLALNMQWVIEVLCIIELGC